MKGVTKLLRDLGDGETIETQGTARDNLYRIARKIGITIKVERFVNGFYVTRTGKRLQGLPALTANSGVLTSLPTPSATSLQENEKQATIAALREAMGGNISTPALVEPVETWIYLDKPTFRRW